MKNGLGFLSASGAVVAAVLLLGVLGFSMVEGPVLFSPGPLSSKSKSQLSMGGVSSHAQLARNCGACHSAFWSSQTMADKCLACHVEVAAQVQAKSGLHGRLVGTLSSPTCRGCHTDHAGPTAALTVTDAATFPHDLTGYSLRGHRRTGTGARFVCADCHPQDLTHFDQAICAQCHASLDAAFMTRHEATFGKSCLLCHNGSNRDTANFDHNKLPFKLTGRHARVACERCHTSALSVGGPQNTPVNCVACHAKDDKHAGRFGQQCGQCHTPDTWANAKFDHSIFPVTHGSQEQQATCQTCHPNDVATYTCFGCHAHTPANVVNEHEGRSLASLTDCVRCHAGGGGGEGGN